MKNIFDIYEGIVLESFKSSYVNQLEKALKEQGSNFKKFVQKINRYVAWDTITDDNIEEIEPNDAAKRYLRALAAGKEQYFDIHNKKAKVGDLKTLVFGMKNGEFYDYLDPVNTYVVYLAKHPYSSTQVLGFIRLNTREFFDSITEYDSILLIHYSDHSASDTISNRSHSRQGMINDLKADDHKSVHTSPGVLGQKAGGINDTLYTYGYVSSTSNYYTQCKSLAQDAIAKYKQIIAANKANRMNTEKIDKVVGDILNRYMKAAVYYNSHAKDEDMKGMTYTFRALTTLIRGEQHYNRYSSKYEGQNGLLYVYQAYIESYHNAVKGGDGYADSEMNSVRAAEKSILETLIPQIEKLLVQFHA